MIPYEKNPRAMWTWDRVGYFRNALMKFGRMMDADYYAHPPAPRTRSLRELRMTSHSRLVWYATRSEA